MFKALEVSKDDDLAEYSRLLWQQKLSHRLHRLEDSQVVAVAKIEDIPNAITLYKQWKQGEVTPSLEDSSGLGAYFSGTELFANGLRAFFRAPVSLAIIFICSILAIIAPLGSFSELVIALLYPDFSSGLEGDKLLLFFKMISPALLHGGLMHLSFNMLWLWEFGKRIETRQASWAMLILMMVLALVSNTIQYFYGGGNNFGGMSGVVYGLFAYIWMWQLFDPDKKLSLPPSLVFFMLLSLGIMTMIGFKQVADFAHVGGLLCGVVYGATVATVSRIQRALKNKGNSNV